MDPNYGIDLSGLSNVLFDLPTWWRSFEQLALVRTIKFLLLVYVVVLFVDIVILLSFRGVSRDLRMNLFGTDQRPIFFSRPRKAEREWEKLYARLQSDNVSQYKVAILEADALADKVMASSRWAGANLGERIASVHPGQVASLDALRAAHAVRNQIVNEEGFEVSRSEAERVLGLYAQFLEEMELI